MADQALYRKWRPAAFDEVVGQEHIVQTIQNALASGRAAHAYLFSGPRGTGKTTTARLVAKALNCTHADPHQRPCNTCLNCVAVNEGRFLDLIEIDAASNTGVDNIRDLRDKINFSPSEGNFKVYVVDECFRYEDTVALADGSKMPIGKIVKENLKVEVLSYNEDTRQIEPKPIVRWMCKPPVLPTVRIKFDNNRAVICTINHKFYTPSGLRHANDLQIGDFVYASYERMTQHQLSVVAGAAIGDGHVSLTGSQMRARLSITQGVDQKKYLDYKSSLLGYLIQSPPVFYNSPKTYSRKGTFRLATRSYPQIAEIHRELYDDKGRKRVSREYLERITSLGLALWYLDDGSLITQDNKYVRKKDGGVSHYPATRSTLSVYGFTVEEAQLIMAWLEETWGIEGGVTATAKGPVIWFTLEGTEKLHDVIATYVPPDMGYKLLPQYRDRFNYPQDDESTSNLAVSIVRDVEEVDPPDFVYNIEVADNHNYFVRDVLVANCHMLSMGAFNALLKTLEEPPAHAIFILATTEIHKVPATVASRCQKHTFRRIPLTEMVSRLQTIAEREKLQVEPSVLEVIARQATGSLRDGISLLDQLVISPDEKVTLDSALALLGAAGTGVVQDITGALAERDSAHGLELINNAIDNGIDPRQLARQLVDYLRGLLLIKLGNPTLVDVTSETRKVMQAQAAQFDPNLLIRAIRSFNGAANEARGGWLSQLPLELAFVESLRMPTTAAEAIQPSAASAPAKAAPAPQAAPPRIESASSPNDPHLDKIISRWKDIRVASKKYHASLPALLERCMPINMEGDLVVLGFQTKVLLTKADAPSNLEGIAKAINDVVGLTVKVRCVLNSHEAEAPPNVPSNSVVAEAVRMGGKITK